MDKDSDLERLSARHAAEGERSPFGRERSLTGRRGGAAIDAVAAVILGLPLDHNSSFKRGARFAPEAIRAALASGSMNWATESGLDLEVDDRWADAGNVSCTGTATDMQAIQFAAATYWNRDIRLVCLGGDHSVTAPILRAAHARWGKLTVVHFDAHPDLYPEFEGNRDSHASPFFRIMEEGLAKRLVQIGVRTVNTLQREAIQRFGVEVVSPDELPGWDGICSAEPVYVSLDLDVLDPAFAPGVSHHEPGGLSVREVLGALKRVRAPVIGADLVELNPERDSSGRSSMVAAKILKELLGRVLNSLG